MFNFSYFIRHFVVKCSFVGGPNNVTKSQFPSHERVFFASLLTMTAGSIDAYSYHLHGQVFAGLQTGNIILLGINVSQFHWGSAGQYIFSLMAFAIGTLVVKFMQHYRVIKNLHHDKEREYILLYMTVLLSLSAIIGRSVPNMLATAILSIAAAAALQEFRILKGNAFMPLLMTGNLRTLCAATYEGLIRKDKAMAERARDLATVILAFFVGALVISLLIPLVKDFAILFSAMLTLAMSRIVHWE
nr:YoaK family protein [Fructobacillus parabroussonetiae]